MVCRLHQVLKSTDCGPNSDLNTYNSSISYDGISYTVLKFYVNSPISGLNPCYFLIGTGVALAGVFLYSRVRRIKPKKA